MQGFEWLKQARSLPRREGRPRPSACIVGGVRREFTYSFEYLGCKKVITPPQIGATSLESPWACIWAARQQARRDRQDGDGQRSW